MNSKIPKILERLLEYCFKLRLYLVPFKPFWDKCEEMPERMRLVLWRAYLFNIADRIAKERGYLGIVTGDNLGQVASQTLENMYAISRFVETPVYRPLISYDKEESVNLAKKIGTYELSIQEYSDHAHYSENIIPRLELS